MYYFESINRKLSKEGNSALPTIKDYLNKILPQISDSEKQKISTLLTFYSS